MNRRAFLSSGALAGLAFAADTKPRRVGLIGCGWYGKSDLFRLLQIAPVEVVSLCDVDRTMLNNCADMVAGRQQSKSAPASTPITATCSKSAISTSSKSQPPTTGTPLPPSPP